MKIPKRGSYDRISKALESELTNLDLQPEDFDMPDGWDNPLPKLPKDILDWIEDARPLVDGYERHLEFLPLWQDIYKDNHWNIMITAGRQVFKSTYCTDLLAWEQQKIMFR